LPDPADDLVSVIVPAYNAERTLDETLRSVRAQTHASLEIIVVDDGSTDATCEVALEHARQDTRVRLMRQSNAGVGAARNAGVRAARGRYVAPIDADDLWRPDKISRQLQALRDAPAPVGLVYTWFAIIDEKSRIRSTRSRPIEEGNVLARMCRGNLAGNGSSALMPREVVLEVGGYDETLHAMKAQGCEDLKLYFQIAERYPFACVREFLTGYRLGAENMSNDYLRMLRSYDLVMTPAQARHPALRPHFRKGRVETLRWLTIRAIRAGAWSNASALLAENFQHDRLAALVFLLRLPVHFTRRGVEDLAWRVSRRMRRGAWSYLDDPAGAR
jgi:glycosyltransferase involved in cell wall biosynthesis